MTSRTTEYGENYSNSVEKENEKRGVIKKFIASSSQQKENSKSIKDIFLFILIGILFLLFRDHYSEISRNQSIVENLQDCMNPKFEHFSDSNKIAIARCYDKNRTLEYINQYSEYGAVLDDQYIFKKGILSEIYHYYVFKNAQSYLAYKAVNIEKSDKEYIDKRVKYHYYIGDVTRYEYPSLEVEYTKKMYIKYLENKEVQFYEIVK